MSRNKFLITQSLLSSWNWSFLVESGPEDFLTTLKRQPIRKTVPMLNGIKFENMITAYLAGAPLDEDHEWASGIEQVSKRIAGSALQVRLSQRKLINNVDFVLYGVLDALKAGTIYDIKFSKTYKVGKYLESPQHPMYFELCPKADTFEYLICDGTELFVERYYREDTPSIIPEIKEFMRYLDKHNLTKTYVQHWRSKY